MAGDQGGSWFNPFDNIAAKVGNTLGPSARAVSGTYDNSSYTPSYQQQPSSTPQVKGATTGAYDGALSYQDGQAQQFNNGAWGDYNSPSQTTPQPDRSAPAYDANEMGILDSQYGRYQTLLDGVDGTLADGLKRLGKSEQSAKTNAGNSYGRVTRDYDTSQKNSQDSKNDAIRGVDTNARTMSNSLRRIIGMAGGSGASANLAADNAVAREASSSRDGVMSSFGENAMALDKAQGRTKDDYEDLLKEIADSRKTQEQSLRGGIFDQRQNLDATMADIDLERTRLRGGDPLAAMQPYNDRFNTNQKALQALPEQYRNIASRDVSVESPKLADYLVDRQALNASKQNGGQEQYSPYKAFLDRNREEEQRI